jgi:hypothetical protein
MTFNEMVDVFHAQYVGWYGDDLGAVLTEFRMVESSPSDHFDGGAEAQEARLFALDAMEQRIRDSWEAA